MRCFAPFVFLMLIVGRTHAAGEPASDSNADLVYNARTGDVVLDASDTPSGVIVAFTISSSGGLLDPPWELPCPGGHGESYSKRLACVDLQLEGWRTVSLGPVLPAGLTNTELGGVLDEATYIYAMGTGGQFDLVVVPETPAPWLVLAILVFAIRGQGTTVNRKDTSE